MPSTRFPLQRLVTVLVLVGLCSAPIAPAIGPASAQAAASTGCFPAIDSVDRSEAVGDVVDLGMLLCFSGSVTVEGPGYRGTARLGDGHHSGQVTLHLNTRANGSAVFGVTSDVLDEVPMNATGNGSFQPGTYTVTVRDYSGDVVDNATVELGEPRALDLAIWRAPRGAASDLRRPADLRESRAAGSQVDSRRRLEDPDYDDALPVATNETVVVRIRAVGLEAAMMAADGSPLARFRAALRETGGQLRVVQAEETVTPERQPLSPDVLNSSATHLVTDHANDTYYLVVDMQRLWGEWDGAHGGRIHLGSREGIGLEFHLTMRGPIDVSEPPEDLVGADLRVVERDVAFPGIQGDRVVLAPQSDERLVALTTLAPGSTVEIELSGAIERTIERSVRPRPSTAFPGFVLPLNLSGVPNGSTVTIRAVVGDSLDDDAVVTALVRSPTATLVAREGAVSDGFLTVKSVTVSHPSVVAVYEVGGPLAGTTAIPPGTTERLPVSLNATPTQPTRYRVVVYRDVDRSGSLTAADEVYREDGSPVVTVVRGVVTETPTHHPSPRSASPTPTPTPTPTATPGSGTTETTTPGLGLATAALALLLTLARCRRRAP